MKNKSNRTQMKNGKYYKYHIVWCPPQLCRLDVIFLFCLLLFAVLFFAFLSVLFFQISWCCFCLVWYYDFYFIFFLLRTNKFNLSSIRSGLNLFVRCDRTRYFWPRLCIRCWWVHQLFFGAKWKEGGRKIDNSRLVFRDNFCNLQTFTAFFLAICCEFCTPNINQWY